MKSFCYPLAVAVVLLIAGTVRSQDAPRTPAGNVGSALADIGRLRTTTTTDSPFSRGLGQVVSGWTHDGIHGQELAERIHWLQQARRGDRDDLPSFRDRDDLWRRDRDDRWSRDIREDRREIRDDLSRLRDDERRVARDREELRRDLDDLRRDQRFNTSRRDFFEDRREVRDDLNRLRDDQQRVQRDREELHRDVADLRRDERGDHHFDRDWADHDRNRRDWDEYRRADRDDHHRDRGFGSPWNNNLARREDGDKHGDKHGGFGKDWKEDRGGFDRGFNGSPKGHGEMKHAPSGKGKKGK